MNRPHLEAVFRLIDANTNRAGEAIRVLEDAARFILDNQDLSQRAKSLRHRLRAAMESLPGGSRAELVSYRDTESDTGRDLTTALEGERSGVRAVCVAAGARAGEALRCLSEYAKVLSQSNADAAKAIDQIRYDAYELERDIIADLPNIGAQWKLCVLITESSCTHMAWDQVARLAVEGGVDCLQLREKHLDDRELVRRAASLVDIAAGRASVIVNDRADIALAANADGVHLGADDLSPRDARRILGPDRSIGATCRSPEDAIAAIESGATCLGIGPVFQSATKDTGAGRGPELLAAFIEHPKLTDVPHLAIGGITLENVAKVVRAGARGVAVCGCVCGSQDPKAACETLVRTINESQSTMPEARPLAPHPTEPSACP